MYSVIEFVWRTDAIFVDIFNRYFVKSIDRSEEKAYIHPFDISYDTDQKKSINIVQKKEKCCPLLQIQIYYSPKRGLK